MLDKLPQSKRLAIAIATALIFFVAYDHFYLSKIRAAMEANATAAQIAQKNAAKSAPQTTAAGVSAQGAKRSKFYDRRTWSHKLVCVKRCEIP